MHIKIDNREGHRIETMKKHYKPSNITIQQLETADFIFNDKVAFEYKTLPDFINSILSGRIIEQAIRLNQQFTYPFIMLQSSEIELQEHINKTYFLRRQHKKGKKPPKFYEKQYYGAINRLNCYVTVITCPTEHRCFESMINQARKCLDNAPVNRKVIKTGNPAYQCLRYCIHGIGPKTAEKIIKTLNLKSIEDIANVTVDDLTTVRGVSRSRAEQIHHHIHDT